MLLPPSAPGLFKYQPLDTSAPSFRLLRIHNATEGPVECTLRNHSFEHSQFPQYKAVSYVWGSSDKAQSVLINGAFLHVPQNLFDMLNNLRSTTSTSEDTFLWIDFICIDQENTSERNHQVQQMKTIYTSAAQVIFYLGQSTPETDFLLESLSMLYERRSQNQGATVWAGKKRKHKHEHRYSAIWREVEEELRQTHSGVRRRLQLALASILERPWFRRVWIIQEVGNARDGIIRCGNFEVPCPIFAFALSELKTKADHHCRQIVDSMPGPRRGSEYSTLFRLLHQFRNAEATMARDRIYALLGLCSVSDDKRLQVDYHKTDDDIIRDTIAHICNCKVEALPARMYPSIAVFLDNLYMVPSRVFHIFLFQGDLLSACRLLRRRELYDELTCREIAEYISFGFAHHLRFNYPELGRVILVRLSIGHSSIIAPEDISVRYGAFTVDIMLVYPEYENRQLHERSNGYARVVGHSMGHCAGLLEMMAEEPAREITVKACEYIDWVLNDHKWTTIKPLAQKGYSGILRSQKHLLQATDQARFVKRRASAHPPPGLTSSVRDKCLRAAFSHDNWDWHFLQAFHHSEGDVFKFDRSEVIPEKIGACRHSALAESMKMQIAQAEPTALVCFQHSALDVALAMSEYCSPNTWTFIVEPFPCSSKDRTRSAKHWPPDGSPVMWWAIKEGSVELVRALVNRHVRLNIVHPTFGNPLEYAIENGHRSLVDFLSSGEPQILPKFKPAFGYWTSGGHKSKPALSHWTHASKRTRY